MSRLPCLKKIQGTRCFIKRSESKLNFLRPRVSLCLFHNMQIHSSVLVKKLSINQSVSSLRTRSQDPTKRLATEVEKGLQELKCVPPSWGFLLRNHQDFPQAAFDCAKSCCCSLLLSGNHVLW